MVDESKGMAGNPWGISFMTMFHMSGDSWQFRTADQLDVPVLKGGPLVDRQGVTWLPLYEAKMVYHYDHRFNTFDAKDTDERAVTDEEKRDPHYEPLPRYWVPASEVKWRLSEKGWKCDWLLGYRNVTNATNERTCVAAILPAFGVGHSLPIIMVAEDFRGPLQCCLLANLSSLVFDYVVRQKIGGVNLTYFYIKQLPVLAPTAYSAEDQRFVVERVVPLVYTSESMRPFAEDMGYKGDPFPWDPEQRAVLRAELDAFYAYKYGLTRDELRYILDPADVYGPAYPSETFRVLKENELKQFGEYRTQRLVLEAWDRLFA